MRRGDPLVAVTDNPVSLTAYWTLATRDRDARSESPIAGDTFAHRFMDAQAREIAEQFSTLKRPNMTLPVRHRLIDDRLAAELARDAELRVVLIGAGFDTRAFRLGGGRWLELDEPPLIAKKEAALPVAEAQNELVRIPIGFGQESLEEKLAPYAAKERTAVVLEGILNYLGEEQTRELLAVLKRLFPRHVVLADMLGRRFIAIYSRALVKRLQEPGHRVRGDVGEPGAALPSRGIPNGDERLDLPAGEANSQPQARSRRWRSGSCRASETATASGRSSTREASTAPSLHEPNPERVRPSSKESDRPSHRSEKERLAPAPAEPQAEA